MADKSLEEVIRDLVSRGELSHLSLTPSQQLGQSWSDSRKGPQLWRASFTMCSKFGISFAEDADPIKAIILACTTAKMKPVRAEKRPMASLELTAERVADKPAASASEDINDLM